MLPPVILGESRGSTPPTTTKPMDSRVRGNDDGIAVILGESRGSTPPATTKPMDSRIRGNDDEASGNDDARSRE